MFDTTRKKTRVRSLFSNVNLDKVVRARGSSDQAETDIKGFNSSSSTECSPGADSVSSTGLSTTPKSLLGSAKSTGSCSLLTRRWSVDQKFSFSELDISNTQLSAASKGGLSTTCLPIDRQPPLSSLSHAKRSRSQPVIPLPGQQRRHSLGSIFPPDEYVGDLLNGRREGFGTLKTAKGVYEGEWKDGAREGSGYLCMNNGAKYEGEFKEGRFHGMGVLTTPRFVYAGQWFKGQQCGYGFFISLENESRYAGQFSDGKANGYGRLVVSNEFYFYGKFEQGVFMHRWWRTLKDRQCGTQAMYMAHLAAKESLAKCHQPIMSAFESVQNIASKQRASPTLTEVAQAADMSTRRRSSTTLNPGSLTALLTYMPAST
eukprot:comp61068_c0_seq1/m.47883 comp61068_c0_seq1/g.47883  ORF comp61068_c0_seq1/g.47883 comp61068_c0_seq1/m.47883 type:complete len:373 (-) comp61068_c0_seq1:58-1176(-)